MILGDSDAAARARADDLSRLTFRFGEWYRVWWEDGRFWARWDYGGETGELLAAITRAEMTLTLADDMADRRDRKLRAPVRSVVVGEGQADPGPGG